jgi:uncharacterized transporter YbjL
LARIFRNGKEVFDRDLLDMRIVTEEIVVKNHNAVGRRVAFVQHHVVVDRHLDLAANNPVQEAAVVGELELRQAATPAA